MADFLLRVAAQNFSATVFDTNDLSTIRGSSLALLSCVGALDAQRLAELAGKGARVLVISAGASELLAQVTLQEATQTAFAPADFVAAVKAELERCAPADAPARLFSIAVACGPVQSSVAKSAAQIECDIRVAQYRTLSFPMPDDEPQAAQPCALNRRLPARPGSLVKDRPASASVATRHAYGRDRRSRFYADLLAGTETGYRLQTSGYGFTDSLADLIARREDDLRLPPALSGKIALLMLDGNGFQARRIALMNGSNGAASVARFSAFVRERQTGLLREVIDFALERAHMRAAPAEKGGGARRLRVETLLWGGDEIVLALPAWAAWDVALAVEAALAGWVLPAQDFPGLDEKQRRLTHAAGLVYANYKTPIRQLRALVGELVDESKTVDKTRTLVSAFAFETVDLPRGGLARARKSLFGADASALTVSTETGGFADATKRIGALKKALPRSQAFRRALAARDWPGGLDAAHAGAGAGSWADETRSELQRVLSARDAKAAIDLLGLGPTPQTAAFSVTEGSAATPLLSALHLWDYVQPLGHGCPDPDREGWS
jgi:hypothetical protein